jgi:hypothetical protein
MTKTAPTRHYIVRDKTTKAPVALIEATSVAQARSHFAHSRHTVEYAEQTALMQAVKAGIEPEKAGDTDEPAT